MTDRAELEAAAGLEDSALMDGQEAVAKALGMMESMFGPLDPSSSDAITSSIMDQVSEDLAQRVHAKTTAMLQVLLPDDADAWTVAGVVSGMVAGLLQELWERSPLEDPDERMESMAATWSRLFEALAPQVSGQLVEGEEADG